MHTLQDLAVATVHAQQHGTHITATDVENILKNVKGTTFASIITVTDVALSAANKAEKIYKVTSAQVQLFNNINEFTNVYENAVKRSAAGQENVESFTSQENYFLHTDCYSIVQHKSDPDKKYLYAIYNRAESVYVHNNKIVDVQHVATFCTPSAQKALLEVKEPTHNVTHDITHNVTVRVIKLSSIVQINAMKQTLTV